MQIIVYINRINEFRYYVIITFSFLDDYKAVLKSVEKILYIYLQKLLNFYRIALSYVYDIVLLSRSVRENLDEKIVKLVLAEVVTVSVIGYIIIVFFFGYSLIM